MKGHRVSMGIGLGAAGLVAFQVGIASQGNGNGNTAQDPGVRTGDPAVGGMIAGLTAGQQTFFAAASAKFNTVDAVTPDGLGPRMNLDSCAGCHAQPAVGGTSPTVNPQVAFATLNGGTDTVPSFISANGPVREARFVSNPDGTPDGGVHDLFTITGRTGAAGCTLAQPDFAGALTAHNVIFRIPTPVFGAGLIEQIPDAAILANLTQGQATRSQFGVRGKANFQVSGRTVTGQTNDNGNDGTVARFGWKAQNKSLLLFAGEAYNVEMGISNELFQQERDETPSCQFVTVPNDTTNTDALTTFTDVLSDIEKFAMFMRFLAPPLPSPNTPGGAVSIQKGSETFAAIGCALCHTPAMMTGNSAVAALRNVPVALFSDLLIHDMGVGLADGVSQGEAGPQEFRTAPLWGLGQRIFFLHDGRTSDLLQAIEQHASNGSEANQVIAMFNNLNENQKQDLLNFLRSL